MTTHELLSEAIERANQILDKSVHSILIYEQLIELKEIGVVISLLSTEAMHYANQND